MVVNRLSSFPISGNILIQRKFMRKIEWILCPVVVVKLVTKLERINYPLYCPKCKQETLIEAKNLQITVIKEPDALDAEPMNL